MFINDDGALTVLQHSVGGCDQRGLACDDKTAIQRFSQQDASFSLHIGKATDIYPVDTVLPVHIVSNHEATAKSTTQDGGMAETSVNAFV